MSNSLTHAALPYPVKHARFSLRLAFRTSAGTPTDPTTPDTEFSVDGGASYSDCAEEITTGGGNGTGYLTLTGAETNHDALDIAAKSANCLTTPVFITPRVLPILESGTAQAGAAGTITLASGANAYDLSGCIVRTTGGTGGGGTGGANNQARVITAYNVSTKVATVEPNWETNPDATTTYDILLTEESSVSSSGSLAGSISTTLGAAGAGLTGIPKTGYKLASDGLDSVSTTAPAGVASNFREMVVQTWRRWFKKSTLTATQLKTLADDGTTVVTTQTVSDDLTTQTQGAAS
jgi:hypothetical protein